MAVIVMQQPPGCSCDNHEAIKAPNDSDSRHFIEIEKEIYERLCEDGQHDGLLQYRGSEIFGNDYRTAIRLEWAPNGQLDRFLKDNCNEVDGTMQIRWITQLAEVLKYVHSKGVTHGDIACHNILLDEHLNAKPTDFAGSSIDGSTFLISCSFRAQPPWPSTPQKADGLLASVMKEILE
ncbi:MAG: hypothetical protein M1813_000155 [Trichoglossum hirsutum]|nr:MAG: hypothetical protein M1813_000155 [Trichoglossum hirsutum]